MTEQPPAAPQPCAGFPDQCPYLLTVDPNPPHHGGGVCCGCNARRDLEDMAFELATGAGVVDPRAYKATLDRYAAQVLTRHAEFLENLPPGGEALKGPYWYRNGITDAAYLARDKADWYDHEAEKKTDQPKED
ncbi:hypothetical protein [Streptomyces olivochromogenes]|uniref:Uncharacterized protein n=1 Tax=Streptomyces olivochromogenes TaxID=1963 RepID=A0A250VSZ7_STROL|nr:hypothetical protein [Streptomyces olivochromogenes]KUN38283.1 hypothetical protein AQJ27_45105 [Streptomyces olivochromogenes]GAX57271.1 hypothetical protein SO3561_08841 [Streptomyces olivochromogenes]